MILINIAGVCPLDNGVSVKYDIFLIEKEIDAI